MLVEPRHESLLHQTWVEYGRSAPSLTTLSLDEDEKIRGSAGAATSDAGTWSERGRAQLPWSWRTGVSSTLFPLRYTK